MNQKGFAPILILVVVLILVTVAGGAYYLGKLQSAKPTEIVCTQDAKQCPDGSYVGRTGPKCEFDTCPTTSPEPSSQPSSAPTSATTPPLQTLKPAS